MRIVTHGGTAHRDEFLACCIVLNQPGSWDEPVIVRRAPAADDLADPGIWVLDIGGRHEPELRNFDHHQLERNAPAICAFGQVFEHIGLLDKAREVFPWLEPSMQADVHGNNVMAHTLGVTPAAIRAFASPLEEYLLKLFAGIKELRGDAPLLAVMRAMGRRLLEDIDAISIRRDWLAAHGRICVTPAGQRVFAVLDDRLQEPGLGLEAYLETLGDIAACIMPDTRGPGHALTRLGDDNPKIDFQRIAGDQRVGFIHATGFMAVTRIPLPAAELFALVDRAQIGQLKKR